jgi:hypothetical protein
MSLFLNEATKKSIIKTPLSTAEREQVKERFGEVGCSFFKDKEGKFYCCTHRARSNSYESINKIPKSVVKSVEATG